MRVDRRVGAYMENNELTIKRLILLFPFEVFKFEFRIPLFVVGNYTDSPRQAGQTTHIVLRKTPTNRIPGGKFVVAYFCPASWR